MAKKQVDGQVKDQDGVIRWYKDNELHRVGGPAVEYPNGSMEWYKNGKRHRLGAPAIEKANGTRMWYKNGKLDRLDGPAIVRADGTLEWWKNDKRHRLGAPAVEHADGGREWWQNGKLHRIGAPAVTHADGTLEWWKNNRPYRDDGPAVEYPDGTKEWHNDFATLVALRSSQGREWYVDSTLSRIDGPAIERPKEGLSEWWFAGCKINLWPGVLAAMKCIPSHVLVEHNIVERIYDISQIANGTKAYASIRRVLGAPDVISKELVAALFSTTDPEAKRIAVALMPKLHPLAHPGKQQARPHRKMSAY